MRSTSRMTMTALAVGLVLMMSSCTATPGDDEPAADLYGQAREQYTAMAEQLHAVIMAIEPVEWRVDQGQYGARPSGCQLGVSSETGYAFSAGRALELPH